MDNQIFIGIDIGTSSVRCTAINDEKNIIASTKVKLSAPENPQPGYYQQKPSLWWEATQKSLHSLCKEISPQYVKAISIDGTSSTVLLVDENNTAVSDALMYNDNRSIDELNHLKSLRIGITDHQVPLTSLSKAVYLSKQFKSNKPLIISHQADWLSSKLTGSAGITDENNALKLGFDVINRQWPQWIQNISIQHKLVLPKVLPVAKRNTLITLDIAEQFSLPCETVIITGTTDSTASTIATGIDKPGEAVTIFGSTMVMKIISEKAIFSIPDGLYSHRLSNNYWLVGGASNSGGKVLEKYFDIDNLDNLSSQINDSKPSGLNYYPLPDIGERFPINDLKLKPKLEPRPKSDSLFLQGIFEGFANIEKLAYRKMHELGAEQPNKIVTAGGLAANNQVLTKLRQKIIGIPVIKASHTEASYGSALIAMQGYLSE